MRECFAICSTRPGVAAYPEIAGRTVHVFVEHDAATVKQITVHFDT
ncbi:MAG: hypothetical protein WKG01_19335 [Kofleriaceae bacterium]